MTQVTAKRKEIRVSARSNETDEVYHKICGSYTEMNQWAEKHNLSIFSVSDKVKK